MIDLGCSRRIGVSILAISLFGCGGSSMSSSNPAPPQGCGMVSPCGGDVTGTWKILGGCSNELATLLCANAPEDIVGEGYTGTLTFNSDMTYTASIVGTGSSSFTIPSACVPQGQSCGQGFVGCTGSGPCTCPTINAQGSLIAGSGTYSLSGNGMSCTTQTSRQGIDYCVQGEFLHLEATGTFIGTGTRATVITSDIVAQKQ